MDNRNLCWHSSNSCVWRSFNDQSIVLSRHCSHSFPYISIEFTLFNHFFPMNFWNVDGKWKRLSNISVCTLKNGLMHMFLVIHSNFVSFFSLFFCVFILSRCTIAVADAFFCLSHSQSLFPYRSFTLNTFQAVFFAFARSFSCLRLLFPLLSPTLSLVFTRSFPRSRPPFVSPSLVLSLHSLPW